MAFRVKPDFSAVWASLGDNTKPVDSYITNGWETVKPPRQYFNWIDNRQDSAIAYLYQAGVPEWDALVDYDGGAGANSYSQGSDGKIYRCLADNGPNIVSIGAKDPTNPLNSAFWTEAFGTKAAVDALAATVSTHTTQIRNGSGVTDAPAWRNALAVPSSADFTGSNQSLVANGYQRLPGGLLIQWGTASVNYDQTSVTVTYPTPFSFSCLNVQCTVNRSAVVSGTLTPYAHSVTAAAFQILGDYDTESAASVSTFWMAIGY